MKRIAQIAKELNVGTTTIKEYCAKLGQTVDSINSKVDQELESQIIDLHKGKIELPNEFSVENPFFLEQQKIISENNQFLNREERLIKVEDTELKTIFSDFEAYTICKGIDNRHAKHIARKYFTNKKQGENTVIEAHSIAMTALQKYGGETLSFFISLPPLPFQAIDATQIFSELDKRRKKQDYPILRINFKNNENESEKIQISYFAEKIDNGRRRNDNILIVKNRTTGQSLMRVSRDGIVLPENNAKQIVPVLQVFVRFSQNTKQTLINYGLETGYCSICGRELTDSKSVRIGVGPVCKHYI